MQIVIVEDDEIILKSLDFFLKTGGYDVVSFDNGADAIAYLQEQHSRIQLLITDLNLPFAGGQEVIHTTRQIKGSHIPIIVLTSSAIEATELEVLNLGADEFIPKPFSPAVLLKRIQKLTNKN